MLRSSSSSSATASAAIAAASACGGTPLSASLRGLGRNISMSARAASGGNSKRPMRVAASLPVRVAASVSRRARDAGFMPATTDSMPAMSFPSASRRIAAASTAERVCSSSRLIASAMRAAASSRAADSRPSIAVDTWSRPSALLAVRAQSAAARTIAGPMTSSGADVRSMPARPSSVDVRSVNSMTARRVTPAATRTERKPPSSRTAAASEDADRRNAVISSSVSPGAMITCPTWWAYRVSANPETCAWFSPTSSSPNLKAFGSTVKRTGPAVVTAAAICAACSTARAGSSLVGGYSRRAAAAAPSARTISSALVCAPEPITSLPDEKVDTDSVSASVPPPVER